MSKAAETKHLLIDLKTGFAFGVMMKEGQCIAAQALNVKVESLDNRLVREFGPLAGLNPASIAAAGNPLPYGQTTYAVELAQDGSRGNLFTIAWPTKQAAEAGEKPQVAVKKLPDDLIQAGFAARPRPADAADDEEALRIALKNIDSMIGLDGAKNDIKQNIAIARFNRLKEEMGLSTKPISRHMVFTGNPGTGKTTFAREVAKVYHALGFIGRPEVHEVKREDLVAGFVGQTAIKTKAAIEKAIGIERDKEGNVVKNDKPKGGILFIDEAYALSKSGDEGKDFGREAIDTLVAEMENMREDLVVIVAGYTNPMKAFVDANPGLKSRFMTYIEFADYNLDELGQIMDSMLKDRGYVMTAEARDHSMDLLAQEQARGGKDFGNGRTVRNLVEKAEKELAMRLEKEDMLTAGKDIDTETLKTALTTITMADVEKVDLRGLTSKTSIGMSFGESAGRANDNRAATPRGLDASPAPAVVAKRHGPF